MLLRDDPDPRQLGRDRRRCDRPRRQHPDRAVADPPEGPVTERMFTGIHVMEPALLDRLRPQPCDVIRDAYIPALEAGARIAAQRLGGYFAEHSTPARYLAGNLDLLHNPSLVPHPPGPLTGIAPDGPDRWRAPDSAVSDRRGRRRRAGRARSALRPSSARARRFGRRRGFATPWSGRTRWSTASSTTPSRRPRGSSVADPSP